MLYLFFLFLSERFHGVVGYHIILTWWGSPDRTRVEPFFYAFFFLFLFSCLFSFLSYSFSFFMTFFFPFFFFYLVFYILSLLSVGFCSSAGRALDWRSKGRWFEPGRKHFFVLFLLLLDAIPFLPFFIRKVSWCSWLSHHLDVVRVPGSNPGGTILLCFFFFSLFSFFFFFSFLLLYFFSFIFILPCLLYIIPFISGLL